jgi:hypothetical protein
MGGFQIYTTSSTLKLGYTSETSNVDRTVWTCLGGQGVGPWSIFSICDLECHGLSFSNNRVGYSGAELSARYVTFSIFGGNWKISNSNFCGVQYVHFYAVANAGSYIKSTSVLSTRWGFNVSADISLASVDGLIANAGYYALYVQKEVSMKNVTSTNNRTVTQMIAINSSDLLETKLTLLDCNLDVSVTSSVYWYNSGRQNSGNEYVKPVKTQLFHITDVDNTNLASASVTLTDKNGVVYSATTNASGLVTLLPAIGVNNSLNTTANNYGAYTNYNPFTLRVSKTSYQTLEKTITIDATTEQNLALVSKLPTTTLIATPIREGLYVAK